MKRRSPFIVAEMSGEHCGEIYKALQLVQAAADAGADAIKVQCFTPTQMADPGVKIESGPWAGRDLLELYRETHTPRTWMQQIFEKAQALNIVAFASVFHRDDVDFMETLNCPIYKISSFEATDMALIEHAADTGKPLIISTGMCDIDEIDEAIRIAQFGGCMDLTMLKCTSAYPTPIDELNLATLLPMLHGWDVQVGLSDHTKGNLAATMAIALGATVIEKHLTLSHQTGGPDRHFALEPEEFADFVTACRTAAKALGTSQFGPTPSEASSLALRRQRHGKRGQKA